MRGLTQFIGDIRNCANKEEERKRVDKEMANIRKHFKDAVKLTPYQKRKYVWKMLYIYVLGYEVDFGHMEALNLITTQGYAEKTVGYLACVLLLSETNEFLRLVINSVKNDLMSHNEEIQSLALACVANVGGREFAETLASDVQKILLSPSSKNMCRKKAALCMLRLLRKYPEGFEEITSDFKSKLLDLLEDPSLGVVTAAMSLLIGLVSHNPEFWEDLTVHKACKLLSKLNHTNAFKEFGQEYVYYKTICPWLQVKILRLLQYYPPPQREEVYSVLCDTLSKLISDVTMQKNVNGNNSAHAVLFEAVNYVIHMENNKDLVSAAVNVYTIYTYVYIYIYIYMYIYIYTHTCVSVCQSVSLSSYTYLPIYVYVYINIHTCIYACLSVCPSVCLSVRPSICLSVCLSICLSVNV